MLWEKGVIGLFLLVNATFLFASMLHGAVWTQP